MEKTSNSFLDSIRSFLFPFLHHPAPTFSLLPRFNLKRWCSFIITFSTPTSHKWVERLFAQQLNELRGDGDGGGGSGSDCDGVWTRKIHHTVFKVERLKIRAPVPVNHVESLASLLPTPTLSQCFFSSSSLFSITVQLVLSVKLSTCRGSDIRRKKSTLNFIQTC